ncbi:MAG TPA: AAA family ATPase, partial [Alphaproteobacteria bacterium]|nr:AAA family ATPase [Alphaproteobacteria bacterium]
QPVEAGPAFRLVTTRLGKAKLNTVLRQKEEWQREATVLFGQQKTSDAIQTYADKGFVHIIEEKLPSEDKAENVVKRYETAHRVSSLIYREMVKACPRELAGNHSYGFIRNHQDIERYVHWKEIERKAAQSIFKNLEAYRSVLEKRCLDPLKMALLLVDKSQPKTMQQEEARELLKEYQLDHLIGVQKPVGSGVEVREQAKQELIQSWHSAFKEAPGKSTLMLAYSNRDVNDLNQLASSLLKASGHISEKEFVYTINKQGEDDFGRKCSLQEEKGFSKGDRIVFTRNNNSLGVKNGTMGTITELNAQKIHVKLDEGKEILFAPNLNPHFDQGWAVTIHKSQGTTVDRTYVLASFEMTQNLAYVAMTRHREDVQVFGSSFDFWRPEKLPQVLAKSGEKLSAADYLDADSLNKLMKADDHLLTKILQRMSNELEAMRAVTKQAFWNVADHFLGITREQDIRMTPEGVREEIRAEEVLKNQPYKEKHEPEKGLVAFNDLIQKCENKLYDYLREEKRSITAELKERISLQAERAANLIFHAHTLRGTEPTEKETKLFLLRGKYELDRIPEISKKLNEEWHQKGNFDEKKDPLLIRMIAERQASIEGRLFLEAKQEGRTPSSIIPQLAESERQQHRSQTKPLAQELAKKYSLSESAAIHCAKDILRYQETHGEKPTSNQMTAMAQISHQLEDKYTIPFAKEVGSHNIEYMRRMDGDLMFRERCSQDKASISLEHQIVQAKMKASVENTVTLAAKDLERVTQREMSL